MKILVIMPYWLGDSIMMSSVLHYIDQKYPNSSYTIACSKLTASIFDDFPNLKNKIIFTKQKLKKHWFHIWKKSILTHWDIIIDFRGSCLSFLLLGQKRIVWKSPDKNTHRIQQLNKLLNNKGFQPETLTPKIWISQTRIENNLFKIPHNSIAIAPFSNWEGKTWPAEYFIQLINKLIKKNGILENYKILFICSPQEREKLNNITPSFKTHLIDTPQSSHLLDVATNLSACKLFIGNDSGILHMAAALNIPTFGLFGPTDDKTFSPNGKNNFTIRTPEKYQLLISKAKFNNSENLMKTLTVDKVYNRIEAYVRNRIE